MRRLRTLLAALGLAALGIATGRPCAAGRLPRYGGDVRVQLARVPANLDPLRLAADEGACVAACVYEGLTRWDGTDVGPALARQWTHDDELRRWRFRLRGDVLFHDGTRCDAAAVVQSLQRLADPRQSPYAWLLAALTGWDDFAAGRTERIEGLDVVAADAVELAFASAVSDLPARLALPASSIARRRGDGWAGTGPFQVLTASPGLLRLAAFREHRAGRPYLDHVEFAASVPGASPLEGGGAELARVLALDPPPAAAARWRAPAARLGLALVQPQSRVLGSETVRHELAQRFDRAVFVRAALGGDGEATEGISPQGPRTVTSRGVEPGAAARASGPQERVRVVVGTSEPLLRALAERLQVHLYAMGLRADLVELPADDMALALSEQSYDVVVLGWTPPQPSTAALGPVAQAQLLATNLLQPILRGAMPDAWSPLRLATGKDPEQALLRGDLCVPLVLFHDRWQTTSDLLHVEIGAAAAGLGLESAHLDAHAR